MNKQASSGGGGRSAESQGVRVLSEVGAIAAAFFGAGPLHTATITFVQTYTRAHYGAGSIRRC